MRAYEGKKAARALSAHARTYAHADGDERVRRKEKGGRGRGWIQRARRARRGDKTEKDAATSEEEVRENARDGGEGRISPRKDPRMLIRHGVLSRPCNARACNEHAGGGSSGGSLSYHKRPRSADSASHRYTSVTAVVSTESTAERMGSKACRKLLERLQSDA